MDYEDWSTMRLIEEVKTTISMWDLLAAMEIDHQTGYSRGVKIALRDETDPSCHIYDDHWFDYGTGEGGDVIDFYTTFGDRKGNIRSRCLALLDGEIGTGTVIVSQSQSSELVDLTDEYWTHTMSVHELVETDWFAKDNFFPKQWAPITPSLAVWGRIRATKWSLLIPHYDWTGAFHGCYGAGDMVPILGIRIRGLNAGGVSAVHGSRFTTQLWVPKFNQLVGVSWKNQLSYVQRMAEDRFQNIEHLVICEGESDTLTVHNALEHWIGKQFPKQVLVAGLPAGAGVWRPEWIDKFLRPQNLHVVVDNDAAGQKLATKIDESHPQAEFVQPDTDARGDLQKNNFPEWMQILVGKIKRTL